MCRCLWVSKSADLIARWYFADHLACAYEGIHIVLGKLVGDRFRNTQRAEECIVEQNGNCNRAFNFGVAGRRLRATGLIRLKVAYLNRLFSLCGDADHAFPKEMSDTLGHREGGIQTCARITSVFLEGSNVWIVPTEHC